ncbi:MAG: hypothetical protein ACRDI3_02660 [Actinomycetota bacterium]
MDRKTDWSEWHQRAVAHLAPDERSSNLDPQGRPPLRPHELIQSLAAHDVEWVLAGSAVFALYGADMTPKDLDIVPSTHEANLHRVAQLLEELNAIPTHQPEWRWTLSISECRRWRPLPAVEGNLDHQFVTPFGILDIVPGTAGSFDELSRDAAEVAIDSNPILVANPRHVASLLAARPKDGGRAMEIDRALQSFESGATPTSPW